MANRFELPKDPQLATKVLDVEHAGRIAEMGKIGVLFGSRDNASIYLAALIIVLAVAGLVVLAVIDSTLRADLAKALGALAVAALGYIFGRGGAPAA